MLLGLVIISILLLTGITYLVENEKVHDTTKRKRLKATAFILAGVAVASTITDLSIGIATQEKVVAATDIVHDDSLRVLPVDNSTFDEAWLSTDYQRLIYTNNDGSTVESYGKLDESLPAGEIKGVYKRRSYGWAEDNLVFHPFLYEVSQRMFSWGSSAPYFGWEFTYNVAK